jgi:hypothetical protein
MEFLNEEFSKSVLRLIACGYAFRGLLIAAQNS